MADIFISYKREDRPMAERLSIALEQLGFDVWWDFDLLSGEPYRKVIRAVIDQCRAAVVLWSVRSIESDFVMDEATYAKSQGKLCPARIDGVDLPFGFGAVHTDDLSQWDGELSHPGFQAMVRAIETRIGRKGKLGASKAPDSQAASSELESFKAAQIAGTANAFKAFLKSYPRGMFASFVRGQLQDMPADAPAHAAAANAYGARPAPPPYEPIRETPRYTPPPSTGGAADSERERKSPWPMLAGGALVVALAALVVALRPWDQGGSAPPQQETVAVESTRDVDAEVEAARRQERDRMLAEQSQRERAAQQREAQETASRDESARAQADDTAWNVARGANSVSGYDAYLSAYPSGRHASDARAARQRLQAANAAPVAYDLALLHQDVRRAVERSRSAESRAQTAAGRARRAETGYGTDVGDTGHRYEGETGTTGVTVVGVLTIPTGETYAGQMRSGDPVVYVGYGVWRSADGWRYEGEFNENTFNGYGVLWDRDGRVSRAGYWTGGNLTTALSR
jgi:hypothetical protein